MDHPQQTFPTRSFQAKLLLEIDKLSKEGGGLKNLTLLFTNRDDWILFLDEFPIWLPYAVKRGNLLSFEVGTLTLHLRYSTSNFHDIHLFVGSSIPRVIFNPDSNFEYAQHYMFTDRQFCEFEQPQPTQPPRKMKRKKRPEIHYYAMLVCFAVSVVGGLLVHPILGVFFFVGVIQALKFLGESFG